MIRKLKIVFLLLLLITPLRVTATEYTAPTAPDFAQKYIPEEQESFGEGLLHILAMAMEDIQPNIAAAIRVCAKLIAVAILISLIKNFEWGSVADLAATVCIGTLMVEPVGVFADLGAETIAQLCTYAKLLIPVMTAALASQGYVSSSAGLYAGTTIFNSILSNIVAKLLVPTVYILIALSIADSSIQDNTLSNIKKNLKATVTWLLKIILYVFTGYMTLTGVISGSADAYAVKAVKLTISGAVPVVGSIISDASEAILVSAGTMRAAAGIYGLFAFLGICIGPFVKIGIQYLLLKLTATVCSIFGNKSVSSLVCDFSSIMGIILAMTGAVCLFLLISTVCFMRGIS